MSTAPITLAEAEIVQEFALEPELVEAALQKHPDLNIATFEGFALAIETAKDPYRDVDATTGAGFALAIEGRAKFRSTRTGIEKRRKQLDESARSLLKRRKNVADQIIALCEPFEEELDRKIKAVEQARENAKKEALEAKERAERERLNAEAEATRARLQAEAEAERVALAEERAALEAMRKADEERRAREDAERKAKADAEERERQARIAAEELAAKSRREAEERIRKADEESRAAEAKRMADEREAQRIEGERLAAERAKLEAAQEQAKAEAEAKTRAEREKRFGLLAMICTEIIPGYSADVIWSKRAHPNSISTEDEIAEPFTSMPTEELAALALEVRSKTRKELEERARIHDAEIAAREAAEAAAKAARIEALKPDCQKLRKFADALSEAVHSVAIPEFSSDPIVTLTVNEATDTFNKIIESLWQSADMLQRTGGLLQ